MSSSIKQIVKRDGTTVSYDPDRIATAIFKAAAAVGGSDRAEADRLSLMVERKLEASFGSGAIPSVEEIQDLVGGKVHLELWVKVREHWTEDAAFLREMGLMAE